MYDKYPSIRASLKRVAVSLTNTLSIIGDIYKIILINLQVRWYLFERYTLTNCNLIFAVIHSAATIALFIWLVQLGQI